MIRTGSIRLRHKNLFRKLSPSTSHLHHINEFHSTSKREILPIIGLALAAVTVRYSYRAVVRMEEEWDEYERELRDFKSSSPPSKSSPSSAATFQGLMGVDLGTTNLRVAYQNLSRPESRPNVIENRDGSRSTPAFLRHGGNDSSVGNMARDKRYELPGDVSNPRDLLSRNGDDAMDVTHDVLRPILRDALDKTTGTRVGDNGDDAVLFGLVSGLPVRPAFTFAGGDAVPSPQFVTAVNRLCEPALPVFVPEAVAVRIAARRFGLTTTAAAAKGSSEMDVVIDVGGTTTSFSIVNDEEVIYRRSISFGGESVRDALVSMLSRGFFSGGNRADGMATQRLHDAAEGAIKELTTKTRSEISVPFLSVDEKMQPRHLERGVSREVLRQEVNSVVKETQLGLEGCEDVPSAMAALFMKGMEESGVNPFTPTLGNVIVVGGGIRSHILREGVKEGITRICGDHFVRDKLIIVEGEMCEELTVMGAVLYANEE
mmetsp:Transcript_64054/g.75828  ORF Transcript_64054/g.75828 Transcript_64054/m.75828 type:complete len:487 (+) Transcript_64054:158-1618(+)|eukprot:CAMPEP_0172507010 /NCGR_PEP_ID=MMETSP1066-20121228/200401_1 /TAXON_ID=671091 /ORGANISM="Coscinodiscus wailesii, Strain CCMP2513" /LENGTH=486 /DNA_ID=CAMNT_0013284349 /DNA_START=136 /DNA_END=1596 /DNA_ORIENTATION=+